MRKLLALVFTGILAASAWSENSGQTYQDWQVICTSGHCKARQTLVSADEKKLAYSSEIANVKASAHPILSVQLPLGVYLPRGLGVSIGERNLEAPFTVCLPQACQALVQLDAALLESLLQEDAFSVRFYTTESAPHSVDFSTAGLASALASMRQ